MITPVLTLALALNLALDLALNLNLAHAEVVHVGVGAGAACEMGGGVAGRCEEVRSCLSSGGVVRREGQVTVCASSPPNIYVCCRKPHLIASQLCDAWAGYWRGREGLCVREDQLIFGGVDSKPGEFPHIARVGLQERGEEDIQWKCGGTLISPQYVLTAAHCLTSENVQYWAQVGDYDTSHDQSGVMVDVRSGSLPPSLRISPPPPARAPATAPLEQLRRGRVIMHPHYNFFKYHDIALLELETPVTLTSRVLPACLPTNASQDFTDKEMTIAGWGWTSFAVPRSTRILQKATVPVVDLLECAARLPDPTGINTPRGILPTQLCAGALGRDSCRGDSGGPLVYQEPREGSVCEHTVAGVVSFGYGCGEIGIYTRVTSYLDWVLGYVAPNNS